MSSLNSIDSQELVASKENIQFLCPGRNASILSPSLQAETDSDSHQELEKQRNAYEIKLRNNISEDPIADWCAYIHWIEQSFPKQAREGKLVLQKCLNKFKDCEKYKNDVRFVKICIKYANIEGNSIELLKQIHGHGIGVKCAELYITWAEKYAVENCLKKANAVFEKGVKSSAQPVELLQEAFRNFQSFLVRKMLNDQEIFQPTVFESGAAEELRHPFSVLQTLPNRDKAIAPSARDNDQYYSEVDPECKFKKIQNKKISTKENRKEPGANKHNANVPFSVEGSGKLPFEVHNDEKEEKELNKKSNAAPNFVLKSLKIKADYEDENFANAPIFYPEPFDPTKKPMYWKEMVYAGGLEFQFEELRAMQYRRKKEEELRLRKYTEEATSDPVLVDSEPSKISFTKAETESLLLKNEDKNTVEELNNRRQSILPTPKDFESPKTPIPPETEIVPTVDNSMNHTIHTKEALSEMQQLWFSKPASPISDASKSIKKVAKSILKPSKVGFNLYVDESCLENMKPSKSLERPLDVTFKLEDDESLGKKSVKKIESENCNDENKGVASTAKKKTGKSKPLVENSKENMCILEKENIKNSEAELYYQGDGDIEEIDHDFSIIQCSNTAITETWNFTKGFQFPRGESTPNIRKSFHLKEDCNESLFENENTVEKFGKNNKSEDINEKQEFEANDKKSALGFEGENYAKNLSVIAETSREYRSSSSGSSGASTLASRFSKNFPYTPSEAKSFKYNLTSTQTTFHKNKRHNLASEGSNEINSFKSPASNKEKITLNTTLDLMTKLNAIESISVTENSKEFVETEEGVNEESNKINVEENKNIDPFCDKLIDRLLEDIDFPKEHHACGYFLLNNINSVTPKVGGSITLGINSFNVKKSLGEGSYAKIYKLVNNTNGEEVIAKFQKPPCLWEFYITREIQFRIQDESLASFFMDVECAYFFKNSSVLLTKPVEFGDLLSVINKMKLGKIMCQSLAMYFTAQMLLILETLHSLKIIHGDIKPDNFLLRQYNNKLQLQLIDFGRGIDMSLFPEDTNFTRVVTTKGFTIVEMKLGKPWTYQIDLYGVANCGHCLLFGEYMKVLEKAGVWSITKVIPRYWARTEWKNFFYNLLNVESCSKLPNLAELREAFDTILQESPELEFNLFKLKNILSEYSA